MLPAPPVTILDGNRFLVADASGDVGSGSEGLYADDVRMLRLWRLRLDGHRTALLGGGEDGGHYAWSTYGQILDPTRSGAPTMSTRRRQVVTASGMRELLEVTNHGAATEHVLVRYEFDADFADLFEVKRREFGRPDLHFAGTLPPSALTREWLPHLGAWRMWAEERAPGRPGREAKWQTGIQISFSEPGVPGEGEVFFEVKVPPRSTWRLDACLLLLGRAVTSEHPDAAGELAASERLAREGYEQWLESVPRVHTAFTPLQATFQRSVTDLAALRMPGPRTGSHRALLPAAGLPWFMAIFGRDTLITCLQTMALGQDLARTALLALGQLQATEDDPERDAEPGKILHELRVGKVAAVGSSMPYYGSVDATPLYLMLAAETWRWTCDKGLMRELEPVLRAALAWIEGPADLTGRGWVEFRRRASRGIDVQSWKDSYNSMLFGDGTRAEPPLAVCEVQGYAYAARLGLAEIARHAWGDLALANRLERAAADLKERFDRDFWVDTPAGGHYALALTADGRQVDSVTSDIGHLLWTGIAADARVERTAEALLAPDMFSGWGVRTMSTTGAGYNPAEYHDGTVWPHDTSIACMGLARYGHRDRAATLFDGLLAAAGHFDWRLPEVLAGFGREETRFPVLYPTSCSPQAWAAAAPVAALSAVLGLEPDPAAGSLSVADRVPAALDLTFGGIPAFGRRWTAVARDGTVDLRSAAEQVAE
ncbi:MAG: glycogen debranching N-terminal domain-containing protein [Mycobacteriales bacterium]